MLIGGLQKQSLIDYPGNITAVIFTQGCNFRCSFCHNPDLVLPERILKSEKISEEYVFSFLSKNKNLLDAVTITGGEPTLHNDLPAFITGIKKLDLLVKLDTNGTNPTMLKTLIDNKLIDFVAMDIKTTLNLKKYKELCGDQLDEITFNKIKESIKIILDSDINHDFRTTVIKEQHSKEDLINICQSIKGSKEYSIQKFNPFVVIDKEFEKYQSYSDEELKEIVKELEKIIPKINLR